MNRAVATNAGWLVLGCTLAGCALPAVRLPESAIACDDPRPQVCTMEFDPVCGRLRTATAQSYSNACSACSDPDVIAYLPGACAE